MEKYLLIFTAVCSFGALAACVAVIFAEKRGRIATEDLLMELLQQELSDQREEALRRSSETRREINETLRSSSMNLTESVRVIGDLQADRIGRLEKRNAEEFDRQMRLFLEHVYGTWDISYIAPDNDGAQIL